MADNEYHRKWREANREKVREAGRRHEAKRREKHLIELKERRANDPLFREREKSARDKYKATHPEKIREINARNDTRPERVLKKKIIYAENKEQVNARVKKNYQKNIGREHQRSKDKAKRYLEMGFCSNCPNPRMPNSNINCEKHWFAQRANKNLGLGPGTIEAGQALKSLLERQRHACAYTGRLLVPGVNASTDHIKSRSKYPELARSLDNIEWVDITVNRMKTDMDRDEFLATCALIAERAGLVKRL